MKRAHEEVEHETNSIAAYMYYRLKHRTLGETNTLVRQLQIEDDLDRFTANRLLQYWSTLPIDELIQDSRYLILESEWIDDYQTALNNYISNRLKQLSDTQLVGLGDILLKEDIYREIYEVETSDEAFKFLKSEQTNYKPEYCDPLFFESIYEPEFHTYLLQA